MRDSERLPAEVELFFQFKHAHHRLTTAVARRVEKTTGVPAAQVSALIHLALLGPCQVRELGERLGLNSAGTTGLVSRLEQRDLVRRAPDPHDRRAVQLRLTDDGHDVAARAQPIIAECAERLTEGLSEAEIGIVTRFLSVVTLTFADEAGQ
jgi:DNA-binding MarR family transcriptional regulator